MMERFVILPAKSETDLANAADLFRAYAAAHGLGWIEDESNASTKHDRNYLRHDILPLLDQRFGGWRDSALPAQDYEWYSRLASGGARFANLEEPLVRYRLYGGSIKSS